MSTDLLLFGNNDPVVPEGETALFAEGHKRALSYFILEDKSLREALLLFIADGKNCLDAHSVSSTMAWVSSTNPTLATMFGEVFGVPVRVLDLTDLEASAPEVADIIRNVTGYVEPVTAPVVAAPDPTPGVSNG